MSDLDLVEDMAFLDNSDGRRLTVRVLNVDDKVEVVYEHNVATALPGAGMTWDIEEVGSDSFTHEEVARMLADSTWEIATRPGAPGGRA